jgi:hypothetical protein
MSTATATSLARPGQVLADLLPASRVRDIALVAGVPCSPVSRPSSPCPCPAPRSR